MIGVFFDRSQNMRAYAKKDIFLKIIGIQLIYKVVLVSAVIFLVAKVCPTLCDPMDCIIPGLPVLYSLPEFQIHAH